MSNQEHLDHSVMDGATLARMEEYRKQRAARQHREYYASLTNEQKEANNLKWAMSRCRKHGYCLFSVDDVEMLLSCGNLDDSLAARFIRKGMEAAVEATKKAQAQAGRC